MSDSTETNIDFLIELSRGSVPFFESEDIVGYKIRWNMTMVTVDLFMIVMFEQWLYNQTSYQTVS